MNSTLVTVSTTTALSNNSTASLADVGNTFNKIWDTLFFLVLSMNFIGNFFVITVIVMDHKFHSTMNFLFVNMALSDFISGVFALLWYVVNNVAQNWRSEWVCRIVAANTITVLSGFVSIFTLTAITLERYYAIVNPIEHRMSWMRFKFILVVIWILAIGCASPYFVVIIAVEKNGQTHCYMNLPTAWRRQLMTTLAFVFMYALPNMIICIAYGKLVKHLWFNRENESMQESHQALLRSRKKITKLLGSVLIVFNLCTFPNVVADFMLSFGVIGYGHKFAQVAILIQIMTTCVNPFIFFIQSKQFRYRLINLLCCRSKKLSRWDTLHGTGSMQYKYTHTDMHHGDAAV